MINGLINVYKEKGYTSFDVVAIMRGITHQKKVGHTGTLDPDAEGVLPICLGNACKLCDMLHDSGKEYVAKFMFGKRTDTLDIYGTVLEERVPTVTEERVIEAVKSFIGGYDQIPPMYSAKKVDGKRLYDLARQGKEIDRKACHVDIYDIEIISLDLPYVEIRVSCGKGTYIRSLCEDIGKKVNELACMTSLKRTMANGFNVSDSLTLEEITKLRDEGKLSWVIKNTDVVFSELNEVYVKKEYRKFIDNGNKLLLDQIDISFDVKDGEKVRVYNDEGTFTGLFIFNKEENVLKPYKMFFGE